MSKHDAAGKMAGYLFQPERAIYWLSNSKKGAKVGIETGDDVVKLEKDGELVREQDKNSISSNYPFSNKSKDLWNTLNIWIEAIKNDEINIEKTKFFMVTNKERPDCLAKRIGKATKIKEINICVNDLYKIAQDPSNEIKKYCKSILNFDKNKLQQLIMNINFCDGNDASAGNELKKSIADNLHISDKLPHKKIIQDLLGWAYDTVLELWRNNEAAWLTRTAFDTQLINIMTRYNDKLFTEKAKKFIPITNKEREKHLEKTFVRQLTVLALDKEDDTLIEAINDFIRCASERTRFSKEGELTKDDFLDFEERLKDRWKNIFQKYKRKEKRVDKDSKNYDQIVEDVGFEILMLTLQHREKLAGQPTEQYYLTRGYYHKLADSVDLGWHPNYDKLFLKKKVDNNDESY